MLARAAWLPLTILAAGVLAAPASAAPIGPPAGASRLAAQDDVLRAQYHFDEGGTTGDEVGTTPESSGNNHPTAVRFAGPVAGRFGNAFEFGPTSRLFTGSPLLELQALTVMAWVKAPATPGPLTYVVGKGGGGCAPAAYALYTGSSSPPNSGGLHFYVYAGGTVVSAPGVGPAIWDGAWHMAAGTFDGVTARLYVDGAEVGTSPAADGPIEYIQSSSNLTVGSYAEPDSCAFTTSFTGAIDEARVYSGAISASAIARMAAHTGPEPPVLALDETPPPPPVQTPSPSPSPPASTPTPPPPVVERNVTEPEISYSGPLGRLAQYRCSDGTWTGLSPRPLFDYTWWRLGQTLARDPKTGTVGTVNEVVGAGPTFTLPRADMGRQFYCEVQVVAPSGRSLRAYSPTTVLAGPPVRIPAPLEVLPLRTFGDVGVRGIDVFQVVQPLSGAKSFGWPTAAFQTTCGGGTPTSYVPSLAGCILDDRDPARTDYAGVGLDQRKPTTAVVYVEANNFPVLNSVLRLDVTLTAIVAGKRLGGALVEKVDNPPASDTPYVTLAERTNAVEPARFDIPAAWLEEAARRGQLDLEATVSIPAGAGTGAGLWVQCQGAAAAVCALNDRFRVDGVGPVVDDLRALTVKGLALVIGFQPLKDPVQVLQSAVQLFPAGERMNIEPFSGVVAITDAVNHGLGDDFCEPYLEKLDPLRFCRMAAVNEALDRWWISDANNRQGYDVLLGVHNYSDGTSTEGGWKRGDTTINSPGLIPTMVMNDGTAMRPVTAAAHEFGHILGIPHADQRAPDPVTLDPCGGNAGDQRAEPWPDDNTGRLQGVKWDRTAAGKTPVADGTTATTARFDLMSYCATETNAWISPRNWNRALDVLRVPRARLAAQPRGAAPAQSVVTGVVGGADARLVRLIPGSTAALPPADPSSSLRVRALDAAGAPLGETGVLVELLTDAPGVGAFAAAVPSGAAALELLSGGTVVDRLARSAPPTVRVTAPARGARVGSSLVARWVASDPDGGELEATVEFSPDGGRTWRNVYQGPSTGSATVPGSYLTGTSRGRLRVGVSDGFDETRATSALFRASGSPPRASIAVPGVGQTLQSGRVLLVGSAFDDRGRRLRGRALTWRAGSRRLGRGERVTATLAPGDHTLRLVARDRSGRTGTAAQPIRVTPVVLQLRTLTVPARVRADARTVAIKIATSLPATLRAGGERHAVGTRARTVRVRLPAKPATGVLKLPVTVRARGARQADLLMTFVVLRV